MHCQPPDVRAFAPNAIKKKPHDRNIDNEHKDSYRSWMTIDLVSFHRDQLKSRRFEEKRYRNLHKPAKILIGGIFPSALLYGLGEMNTFRLERRVQELHRACVAATEAEAKKQGTLPALTSIFSGKATCDPVELARSNGYTAIQGQLAAAERLDDWSSSNVLCMAAANRDNSR